MNEQETRLNAALDVLKDGVAALITLVTTLVANNPDLADETAAIDKLGTDIQAAIETAQGGGEPEPIPVPQPNPEPGNGDTGSGDTSGGGSGESPAPVDPNEGEVI